MQPRRFGLITVVLLFKIVDCQNANRFTTECYTPNNKIGFCVEIQQCKILMQQVELNNTASFEFIRASRCRLSSKDSPNVCCGPDANFIQTDGTTNKTTSTSSSTTPQLSVASYGLLSQTCGKQEALLGYRIFGGTEANIGEFPWLARLVYLNEYNRTRFGCSGFLIHRRFILTAAHCLRGEGVRHLGSLQSVILGMHNDTKARICLDIGCSDPPLYIKTLTPVVHDGYDSILNTHDIALIPLSENINFTDFIKPICIPSVSTNALYFTVSGWGRTEADSSSKTKLKVVLPLVNKSICSEKYKSLGLSISNMQLCAGGKKGQDSCSGDSGGPLMAQGANMQWYAEGIVSFGNNCGTENWPGVYTNIPAYYNWITAHIFNIIF